jgi:RNase P/RNase MRP subunit p29
MQINDKVLVTYSNNDQKAGRIVDETPKMWKILFDDENEPKRVSKKQTITLIDDPETPEAEVITIDLRFITEKLFNWVIKLFKKS